MSNNRTFFKNVKEGHMSLKDIFSDVLKKHTPEESARVLIAGTPLTTPKESEMLSGWKKPYLFARFFVMCAVIAALAYFMINRGFYIGSDILLIATTLAVPMSLLILTWEMNIPRDISLLEVLKLMLVGGMLSIIFAVIFNIFQTVFVLMTNATSLEETWWAPLVEEPAKLLVIYLVLKRKNHKYILDGVLIGMAVGTGFAVMESIGYVMDDMRMGMIESLLSATEADPATYTSLMNDGLQAAMSTAFLRAAGGIASHGTYAALYGGGLMIAKGAHPVQPKHLLHLDHLKYFLVACLLHAANNSNIAPYIMALFGSRYAWAIVETVLVMLFFLPLLRKGVNQIVDISAAHNGGRVTMAVNRNAPAPGACTAQLEFVSGPAAGRTFSVGEGQSLTLGRGSGCDVALPGANSVSGTHCTVQLSGGRLTVTDLGSTNGTYISDRRLSANQSAALTDGTVVCLGNRDCAFRVHLR